MPFINSLQEHQRYETCGADTPKILQCGTHSLPSKRTQPVCVGIYVSYFGVPYSVLLSALAIAHINRKPVAKSLSVLITAKKKTRCKKSKQPCNNSDQLASKNTGVSLKGLLRDTRYCCSVKGGHFFFLSEIAHYYREEGLYPTQNMTY